MRMMSPRSHQLGHDWQLTVAVGFIALTVFGGAVDRRNALADGSGVGYRSVERAVAAPTTPELVREMLMHD